jgi:ribonuclease R
VQKAVKPRHPPRGLPDAQTLQSFIEASTMPLGKRELVQAFGLNGQEKVALKAMLKQLEGDGLIEKGPDRAYHVRGGLPKAGIVRVSAIEADGALFGVVESVNLAGVTLRILEPKRLRERLVVGDRMMARIEQVSPTYAKAHMLKKLERKTEPVLGVLTRSGDSFRVIPADKRMRVELAVDATALGDAQPGDLVLAEPSGRGDRSTPRARITESYGKALAPRAFSRIAIHAHGLPDQFSADAIADAAKAARQSLGEREDLRGVDLVTIDPEDARDHDDAIYAAPEGDGWRIIVAIADVSFYVRPGSALDAEARERGNSVYFPDRVVPMLPDILSGDVCSLKEHVDRACLAAHLHIDNQGKLLDWRFSRAVMTSRADLTYGQAQAAIDGRPDAVAAKLLDPVLKPLWGAWKALTDDRSRRAPLDIDLPEKQVKLDEAGRIVSITPRARFDAHKVVEDFMILANVAAAKQLAQRKAPCIARVHEPPAREKLVAFREFLDGVGVSFALGQVMRPDAFNRILDMTRDLPEADLIQEMVLRTQTQAYYTPEALGHFGLALRSYAHFTSPIRRYADLVVHRSLVRALGLGDGALTDDAPATLEKIADHVSMTERRAMAAERDTLDRYIAAHLATKVGETLETRISGVTRFGLFLKVEGIGGDGLVPLSTLGDEYFEVDTTHHRIEGRTTGTTYRLGQKVQAKLLEANSITGGLRFAIVGSNPGDEPPKLRSSGRRSGAGGGRGAGGPPGQRPGRRPPKPRASGRGKR